MIRKDKIPHTKHLLPNASQPLISLSTRRNFINSHAELVPEPLHHKSLILFADCEDRTIPSKARRAPRAVQVVRRRPRDVEIHDQ